MSRCPVITSLFALYLARNIHYFSPLDLYNGYHQMKIKKLLNLNLQHASIDLKKKTKDPTPSHRSKWTSQLFHYSMLSPPHSDYLSVCVVVTVDVGRGTHANMPPNVAQMTMTRITRQMRIMIFFCKRDNSRTGVSFRSVHQIKMSHSTS